MEGIFPRDIRAMAAGSRGHRVARFSGRPRVFSLLGEGTLVTNYTVAMQAIQRYLVSASGQMSVPAAVRHRWHLDQGGPVDVIDLGFGVLRLITRRSLAYEPNVQIFIFWMMGASMVLISVAILFLRNQIRPILRLAAAAEDFGKGRDVDFLPRGAREVRQAGYAFVEMKRRIERATEQRTAMLNGVSHDLRTILTRFRLSVEIMDETPEREFLLADAQEMQAMLEAYLAFARGDGGEPTSLSNLRTLLEDLRMGSKRHGAPVELETKGDLHIKIRPLALKRCIGNLIANAQRHADNVLVQASRENRFAIVHVDDDGPGIAPAYREDVFRPFLRLDEARNQDQAGSGLGLAIARDIARSHGGDISLAASPLGGLRATVRIPI